MNFAHSCEFWCFSLGKQARFTSNFGSKLPPGKVHELAFLWFGLPGPLQPQPRTSSLRLLSTAKSQSQSSQRRELALTKKLRKILASVKFLSAILGPEMAAPILWTPGENTFFLQGNLHVHKILVLGGGLGILGFGGGGSADFIFVGSGIFLKAVGGLPSPSGLRQRGLLSRIAPLLFSGWRSICVLWRIYRQPYLGRSTQMTLQVCSTARTRYNQRPHFPPA